ncbi:MAG: transposase [Phycisphaerales bacterium]|nr:transposase [Phycisphaerales bacterium]
MPKAIVIAHHLIWTAYGWWLPNDPRGSTSRTIRKEIIARLGEIHHGRKRIQPATKVLRTFFDLARSTLKHPLMEFDDDEASGIAEAFRDVIEDDRYTCYACAIMPDHIHLLIRKHKHLAEEMIANFQDASRLRLRALGLRSEDHPVWGGPGWKVFLDHPSEIQRTVRYIEENPIHIGRPRQNWPFVMPYDNWPFHEGHDPSSPYVRALRAAGRSTY